VALTAQQELFIEEYIKCRKGAEAARRAGYSEHTARTQASRLLTNVDILKEIQERTKANAMDLDEAFSRLADFARADLGQWLSDDGAVDIAQMKRDGATHFIRKVKRTEKSGVTATGGEWSEVTGEVELYDALSATKFVADLHKRGPSGKEDDPLHVKHTIVKGYATVTPDDWDEDTTDSHL
jgi:phage terminase small subunit